VPGSKYAAVRAVLASALAGGDSTVANLPRTDDTAVLLSAMERLSIAMEWRDDGALRLHGCGGAWPVRRVEIDAGNAGAVLRLLLGVTAPLDEAHFTTSFPESLGARPNADLLDALRQLGVEATAREPGGRLPITLRGAHLHGGAATVAGGTSSQYLSALLMLAPLLREPLTIAVTGELRSASFVRLTAQMMGEAGIVVEHDGAVWRIPAGQAYQPREWRLAGDFPSAIVWLAASALAGGTIAIGGLDAAAEDGRAALAALAALGAQIATRPDGADRIAVEATGGALLIGTVIDGEPLIDSVPVLAAVAACARGTTTFTRVGALRVKESNRIDDLCAELNRAGARAVPGTDTLTVEGMPEGVAGGVTVASHHDHRLAMALALLALRARAPLAIAGADHVAKSFPAFWDELARLGAEIVALPAASS
jgi:3-phosphoshikimate 1-carboxyvinyltransferase